MSEVDRTLLWPPSGAVRAPICDLDTMHLLHIARGFDQTRRPVRPPYRETVAAELGYRGLRRPGPARVWLWAVTSRYAELYCWRRTQDWVEPERSFGRSSQPVYKSYLHLKLDGREVRQMARLVHALAMPACVWADWLDENVHRLRRRPEKIEFLTQALRAGV